MLFAVIQGQMSVTPRTPTSVTCCSSTSTLMARPAVDVAPGKMLFSESPLTTVVIGLVDDVMMMRMTLLMVIIVVVIVDSHHLDCHPHPHHSSSSILNSTGVGM